METTNQTDIATLLFKETYSIPQFMDKFNLDKVDAVISPKTGKRFFTTSDPNISGKADKTGAYKENPVISLCEDPGTSEEFYMLHKQSTDNVEHSFAR